MFRGYSLVLGSYYPPKVSNQHILGFCWRRFLAKPLPKILCAGFSLDHILTPKKTTKKSRLLESALTWQENPGWGCALIS